MIRLGCLHTEERIFFFPSNIYVHKNLENSSLYHLACKGQFNIMPDMVYGADCTVIQNIQLVVECAGVI